MKKKTAPDDVLFAFSNSSSAIPARKPFDPLGGNFGPGPQPAKTATGPDLLQFFMPSKSQQQPQVTKPSSGLNIKTMYDDSSTGSVSTDDFSAGEMSFGGTVGLDVFESSTDLSVMSSPSPPKKTIPTAQPVSQRIDRQWASSSASDGEGPTARHQKKAAASSASASATSAKSRLVTERTSCGRTERRRSVERKTPSFSDSDSDGSGAVPADRLAAAAARFAATTTTASRTTAGPDPKKSSRSSDTVGAAAAAATSLSLSKSASTRSSKVFMASDLLVDSSLDDIPIEISSKLGPRSKSHGVSSTTSTTSAAFSSSQKGKSLGHVAAAERRGSAPVSKMTGMKVLMASDLLSDSSHEIIDDDSPPPEVSTRRAEPSATESRSKPGEPAGGGRSPRSGSESDEATGVDEERIRAAAARFAAMSNTGTQNAQLTSVSPPGKGNQSIGLNVGAEAARSVASSVAQATPKNPSWSTSQSSVFGKVLSATDLLSSIEDDVSEVESPAAHPPAAKFPQPTPLQNKSFAASSAASVATKTSKFVAGASVDSAPSEIIEESEDDESHPISSNTKGTHDSGEYAESFVSESVGSVGEEIIVGGGRGGVAASAEVYSEIFESVNESLTSPYHSKNARGQAAGKRESETVEESQMYDDDFEGSFASNDSGAKLHAPSMPAETHPMPVRVWENPPPPLIAGVTERREVAKVGGVEVSVQTHEIRAPSFIRPYGTSVGDLRPRLIAPALLDKSMLSDLAGRHPLEIAAAEVCRAQLSMIKTHLDRCRDKAMGDPVFALPRASSNRYLPAEHTFKFIREHRPAVVSMEEALRRVRMQDG